MRQAPDWLSDEERLERLAKGRVLGRSDSVVRQTRRQLRTAFDVTAALVVIVLLGLLCWNWNGPSLVAERSGMVEYKNAFYRALDEGPPPRSSSILHSTGYPFDLMPEVTPSKSPLDRLLLPDGGGSLQTWLEGNDAGQLRLDNSLKRISLSPPEAGRKQKKAWKPVRDLMGEVPRGID